MRHIITLFAVVGLLALTACSSHPHGMPPGQARHFGKHPHGMPPGQARKVAHVHGYDCGHVHTGSTWVSVEAGHVHGPGCGHVKRNGAWYVTIHGGN